MKKAEELPQKNPGAPQVIQLRSGTILTDQQTIDYIGMLEKASGDLDTLKSSLSLSDEQFDQLLYKLVRSLEENKDLQDRWSGALKTGTKVKLVKLREKALNMLLDWTNSGDAKNLSSEVTFCRYVLSLMHNTEIAEEPDPDKAAPTHKEESDLDKMERELGEK